jgi:transmembrane sensor
MGTDEGNIEIYDAINRRKSARLVMIRAAAALLIITAIGLTFYKYSFDFPAMVRAISWVTYATADDEASTIRLPDGSQVVLSPGTTLLIPENFTSAGKREVKLENGEAYFTISPDAKRPFFVHSGPNYTTVLGTSLEPITEHVIAESISNTK